MLNKVISKPAEQKYSPNDMLITILPILEGGLGLIMVVYALASYSYE